MYDSFFTHRMTCIHLSILLICLPTNYFSEISSVLESSFRVVEAALL